MKRSSMGLLLAALVATGLVAGCRGHMPHAATWVGGNVARTHAKPAEGGYYGNWDPYAVSLEVVPVKDVNPVGTQHVLIATVKDADGRALPNRRVEGIIPDGSVGAIVEVDESGWRASRGNKLTNKLAISHTNNFNHVLTRGNDDPADDVHLKKGQTWCVVTSPIEGTTHVIAYAPGIYDWKKHKVFVKKHWYDVAWVFPPAATNPIGTAHKFTTKVTQHSDGEPLAGYEVTYKILSGPAAVLEPGGKTTATVKTDAAGLATVTLKQAKPAEGANEVQVDIVRPANEKCCRPAVHIATGRTKKTWVGPKIAISKTGPARAIKGQTFAYVITVSNPSTVAATEVVVTDTLPDGLAYVGSDPKAKVTGQALTWSLGEIAGKGSRLIGVRVKGNRTGRFTNCAEVKAAYNLSGRNCAATLITAPSLALVKQAPAEVLICRQIPYTLIVRNAGDAPATNVTIQDTLPAGLTATDGRKVVNFRMPSLGAGQRKEFKFAAKAAKTGTYVNKGVATADGGLKAEASATTVVRQPVLVITKSAPARRYIGRPMKYDITVTNRGDATALNTVLTDTLPAGATFVVASAGGTLADGKVTWRLGDLAVNAKRKVSLTLRADRARTVRNTVSVTAVCARADAAATTVVSGVPAILLECIDVEDPIEVGARETYVITVTNQGSARGTGIVIACTLPAEEEFISATGPTKEEVQGKKVTFAPLRSLAPKAKATYRVVVKGVKAGDVRFKVSLTSDQMTSPAEETESTHIYAE